MGVPGLDTLILNFAPLFRCTSIPARVTGHSPSTRPVPSYRGLLPRTISRLLLVFRYATGVVGLSRWGYWGLGPQGRSPVKTELLKSWVFRYLKDSPSDGWIKKGTFIYVSVCTYVNGKSQNSLTTVNKENKIEGSSPSVSLDLRFPLISRLHGVKTLKFVRTLSKSHHLLIVNCYKRVD